MVPTLWGRFPHLNILLTHLLRLEVLSFTLWRAYELHDAKRIRTSLLHKFNQACRLTAYCPDNENPTISTHVFAHDNHSSGILDCLTYTT